MTFPAVNCIEFTSVLKITISFLFRFSNFQLTSIKAKSRTLLKLKSKWQKLTMKLIMVSTVNSTTRDSPKSFKNEIQTARKLSKLEVIQIKKTV